MSNISKQSESIDKQIFMFDSIQNNLEETARNQSLMLEKQEIILETQHKILEKIVN